MEDEITKELSKILDKGLIQKIYEDGLSSPAKETGEIITDVIKTARLFTAPFQLAAAYQDRFRGWIYRTIRQVPEERRVPASPQIAGPIFEELRYREDGEPLTEMYLNLLAKAIDKDQSRKAHPAFVKVIGQLSPDEALLINGISKKNKRGYFGLPDEYDEFKDVNEFYDLKESWERGMPDNFNKQLRQQLGQDNSFEDLVDWLCVSHPIPDLIYPKLFYLYIEHLESLNLIKRPSKKWNDVKADWISTALTDFGLLFVQACEPNTAE